jgi:CMP-N,N'-diacetyllegionaminic acid synthase
MNIFTVIPARGGSKSIPRKNIQLVNGAPLIKYSIDYSLASSLVSKTIVSTDDLEIAEMSRDLGAEVPFIRPKEYALDNTQDFPVIYHALEEIEKNFNVVVDMIILLRPTSPIRPPGLIEEGVRLLQRNPEASSVRAVAISKQHPFRQWIENDEFIDPYDKNTGVDEPYNLPRQELPTVFFQTGDIEIIRRETIRKGSVSGENILPLQIDQEHVFDIDEFSDLIKAEVRIVNQNEHK